MGSSLRRTLERLVINKTIAHNKKISKKRLFFIKDMVTEKATGAHCYAEERIATQQLMP